MSVDVSDISPEAGYQIRFEGMHRLGAAVGAVLVAGCMATPAALDARVSHSNALASKKAAPITVAEGGSTAAAAPREPSPLLATLIQTHTDERVPLDDTSPTQERFASLLADRVTGERHEFDPRLLTLLRSLAKKHAGARFELVSGYRSPKLNEMMRKKGHHVASHSQHSLGHAVDFRIVLPDGDPKGMSPLSLEKEIRDLGWDGGVGVYPTKHDWFVHADVGKNRRWVGN